MTFQVTIPPNLTDLLANLPDDINADSIQKMFRDSVDDRRALVAGMDRLKNQLSSVSFSDSSIQKKVS